MHDAIQAIKGGVLPTLTIVALACFTSHVIPGLAVFSLCLIGWVEWKVEKQQRKLAIKIYILAFFLVFNALFFVALVLPFASPCETL